MLPESIRLELQILGDAICRFSAYAARRLTTYLAVILSAMPTHPAYQVRDAFRLRMDREYTSSHHDIFEIERLGLIYRCVV